MISPRVDICPSVVQLPITGSNVFPLLVIALGCVVLGAGLIIARRRGHRVPGSLAAAAFFLTFGLSSLASGEDVPRASAQDCPTPSSATTIAPNGVPTPPAVGPTVAASTTQLASSPPVPPTPTTAVGVTTTAVASAAPSTSTNSTSTTIVGGAPPVDVPEMPVPVMLGLSAGLIFGAYEWIDRRSQRRPGV